MIAQNHPLTKSSKPTYHLNLKTSKKIPLISATKSLDFSAWASDNSFKLVVITVLTLTVAAYFFFFHNSIPISTPLFCTQNTQIFNKPQTLKIPKPNFKSIHPILDKSSPYSSFHSEQWIIVSVSDYPSIPLQNLVRIKGWQVLAVGNSKTPKDWSLKGAIYLSLEQQAELGFRVVDYLPYDSYVRKSVGYLFAIQHGARKIFDADDRGEVIGANLGKQFDLDLESEVVKQERILQYNDGNSNRTVVNPYVHFGQRSLWPRGLPLQSVGEVGHEEFYSEVDGGKQYIQQGISNGLPDVDSFFYATRKVGLEVFDIKFDEQAPKVAASAGIMVPLNSFNTLFHYDAFWALMLPVSVSTMASDVLRGYFGQRLLWEIGGYVVVYPPTIHRVDKTESFPLIEEKDLHVNVGRLIEFLIGWRSEKKTLFEKIVELGYFMEKEGFWNENDVKFTHSWLEDLMGVGYQYPGLMEVEMHRQNRKTDRKEFVPRKLPSMHLGVEESGTVNYEIGNLIRWRRNLGDVVLIMFVSGPVQQTALEWRLLYGRIFKTVVILSTQADADLAVLEGQLDQIYKYLPKLFDRFNNTRGFLFLHDSTILNYWSLMQADTSKLWIPNKVPTSKLKVDGKDLTWFAKQADMVKRVVGTMPAHLQINYKESSPSQQTLALCGSEVFYIPQQFVSDFVDLVGLVGDLDIHHKIAIPMFFMAMDLPHNFDPVLNKMIYKANVPPTGSLGFYSAQVPAVYPFNISSESDFVRLIELMAEGDPLLMELF